MVMECPECCHLNSDNAVFCASCGIQLRITPPVPYSVPYPPSAPVVYPFPLGPPVVYQSPGSYESLKKTIEELSTRNQNLEKQLQDQNRRLEADLDKAKAEVRSLETQVKSGEAARQKVEARMAELVEENRQLVQRMNRVPRLGGGPNFCERCGRHLVATADSGVMRCQACNVTYPRSLDFPHRR